MGKFWYFEILTTIGGSALLVSLMLIGLRKAKKEGFWLASFFVLAVVPAALFFVCLYSVRYFEFLACKSAYGEAALVPKMCDNPARGLLMVFDFLVVGVLWFILAPISAFVLRDRKSRLEGTPAHN